MRKFIYVINYTSIKYALWTAESAVACPQVNNVDAGYDETKGSGCTGAVIRDSTGGFIAASHSYIPHVLDAAMAEATALRDGLLLAQLIGCSRVEFQSDCMEVVTTMQEGFFLATAAGTIYDECYLYWKDFHSISISHCIRV